VPRREMLDAPFASLEAEYQSLLERHGREGARVGPGRSRSRRDSRPRAAPRV
jgi:hypothetical protein